MLHLITPLPASEVINKYSEYARLVNFSEHLHQKVPDLVLEVAAPRPSNGSLSPKPPFSLSRDKLIRPLRRCPVLGKMKETCLS